MIAEAESLETRQVSPTLLVLSWLKGRKQASAAISSSVFCLIFGRGTLRGDISLKKKIKLDSFVDEGFLNSYLECCGLIRRV